MPHKIDENSKYYNPDWKIYTCPKCGDEHYTKFQDYEECMSCLEPVFKTIQEKLISYNNERIRLITAWKAKYESKKSHTDNIEPRAKTERTPDNRKGMRTSSS